MTKGTLPPQAYTREMLTQAFQWVQTQPESIRKLADSADALVGLFLRAKRSGDANLETSAPVSTENFRANLKSLAAELQQFSDPTTTPINPGLNFNEFVEIKTSNAKLQEVETKIPPVNFMFPSPPKMKTSLEPQPESFVEAPRYATEKAPEVPQERAAAREQHIQKLDAELDAASRLAVQKVQRRFNLSSESEALRFLIALGAEKLEKL